MFNKCLRYEWIDKRREYRQSFTGCFQGIVTVLESIPNEILNKESRVYTYTFFDPNPKTCMYEHA
jgi:hypothetical protein